MEVLLPIITISPMASMHFYGHPQLQQLRNMQLILNYEKRKRRIGILLDSSVIRFLHLESLADLQ